VYRLFIDETGHDHLKSSNTAAEQFLCLMGVILNGKEHRLLKQRMDALKMEFFGSAAVVLHRREIIDKNPPFDVLRNPEVRARFDVELLKIIAECEYTVLTALIDKQAHLAKYQVWRYHPYHYCLAVILERYVMWLKEHNPLGALNRKGDVMVEWRGIKPNMKLERSFTRLYNQGTGNVSVQEMQTYLGSSQLKLEKKEANAAGLQLADLIANPARTHWVCESRNEKMKAPFGLEVVKILISQKYRRSEDGTIEGYGLKRLP
jgi:Protein of unknown function (DUF3800)